jgi:hypothetical protein
LSRVTGPNDAEEKNEPSPFFRLHDQDLHTKNVTPNPSNDRVLDLYWYSIARQEDRQSQIHSRFDGVVTDNPPAISGQIL